MIRKLEYWPAFRIQFDFHFGPQCQSNHDWVVLETAPSSTSTSKRWAVLEIDSSNSGICLPFLERTAIHPPRIPRLSSFPRKFVLREAELSNKCATAWSRARCSSGVSRLLFAGPLITVP